MDIEQLREDLRAYLSAHPYTQTRLALELQVSASWLNKFCNGHFPNIRLARLQHLQKWVAADRTLRAAITPTSTSAVELSGAA